MTRRLCIGSAALLGALLAAPFGLAQKGEKDAKPGGEVPKEPPIPVVRLAAQAKEVGPALRYALLPDPLDQVDGNAAPFWIRAALAARGVRHKWTERQWEWAGPSRTPLDKLPRQEVKEVLAKYAAALRLVDQAALRTRCDWGRPAPTMQALTDLPFDEIQYMRELANLINLRCRLAFAEKDFDAAVRSLRAGYTLARHLGQSDLMIQDLVGIAIAAITLGRVEEWVTMPGSPNLYWPLTELPRPLIDARRSIRAELGTVYRSFPQLRELKSKKLTAEEANRLVDQFFEAFAQLGDTRPPPWLKKFSAASAALAYYPVAKKGLIARGRPAREVEALPAVQAIAVYYLDEYDRARDDILKWLALPGWQGYGQLQKVEQQILKKAKEDGNVVIALLLPALVRVYHAQMRTERVVAGLRGAEALRWHAAAHGGRAPAKWADITEVPSPIDPFTGRGLGEFYRVEGGAGVLTIPPSPPQTTNLLARRYVLGGRP